MSEPASLLADVQNRIAAAARLARRDPAGVTLIAVSKTHPAPAIVPLIAAGQLHTCAVVAPGGHHRRPAVHL